jgi:hypothetical protein
MLSFLKKLEICDQGQQRSDSEKTCHCDLGLKLEAQRFFNQEQMFKIQADGNGNNAAGSNKCYP